jgi:hypothetical protein
MTALLEAAVCGAKQGCTLAPGSVDAHRDAASLTAHHDCESCAGFGCDDAHQARRSRRASDYQATKP